ncbi:MAG TPA: YbhB/YbcL family Raf kinase inhibitor-like protein [Candidatus Acidoferrum sp.]|nr:YbhB/YbcL family Raf kinase inhibitor-like protein [Candidatus Acidoferrum sp.]
MASTSQRLVHTSSPKRCAIASILLVLGVAGLLTLIAVTQIACNRAASQQKAPTLELASANFSGDTIPKSSSSCNGQDGASPELSWKTPPEGTQSFALIVTDKDSPLGFNFVHWVLYDIPPDKRELPKGIGKLEQLPDGSRQGHNDYDRIGYVGPCPPGHALHRYVFDLYALDTKLNLQPRASKKQVVKAMKGHVLASGELVGRFQQ